MFVNVFICLLCAMLFSLLLLFLFFISKCFTHRELHCHDRWFFLMRQPSFEKKIFNSLFILCLYIYILDTKSISIASGHTGNHLFFILFYSMATNLSSLLTSNCSLGLDCEFNIQHGPRLGIFTLVFLRTLHYASHLKKMLAWNHFHLHFPAKRTLNQVEDPVHCWKSRMHWFDKKNTCWILSPV